MSFVSPDRTVKEFLGHRKNVPAEIAPGQAWRRRISE
jgi:hypothetical protein